MDKKFQSSLYEFLKNHCSNDLDSVKSDNARTASDSWATTSASIVTSSIKSNGRIKKQRGGADAALLELVKKLSWLSSQRHKNSSDLSFSTKKNSLTSELIEDSVSLWENSERSRQSRSFKVKILPKSESCKNISYFYCPFLQIFRKESMESLRQHTSCRVSARGPLNLVTVFRLNDARAVALASVVYLPIRSFDSRCLVVNWPKAYLWLIWLPPVFWILARRCVGV